MIRKAQPKEGLETGGLISGSEAARARIAAEYEPDLSGANGPTARFDALRELIGTEIGAAQNQMTFASGDGSQIFGRDGRFAVSAPSGGRTAGTPEEPTANTVRFWDVEVVSAEDGTVKISCPGVVTKAADVDDTSLVAITDISATFTMTEGKYLCLTVTPALAVAVEAVSTWTGFPFFVHSTADGDGYKQQTKAYFPLWKCIAKPTTEIPGLHKSLNSTLSLIRLAPDAHLQMVEDEEEEPGGQLIQVVSLRAGWGAA